MGKLPASNIFSLYALRSYTWRHNEVLEISAEAAKICCETANKAPISPIERFISLKKEIFRNFRIKNMYRSSLLDGCTDWHVATDLEHHFVFPSDIVIWSVKAGVTNPSASSGCGSGPTSNWSEIDRKYKLRWMLRWEPGFQGGCP